MVRTSPQVSTRAVCPCGQSKVNNGEALCGVCRSKGLPVCVKCGASVSRRGSYCQDCRKVEERARSIRQKIKVYGAYVERCPECSRNMHCIEDYKMCTWCGFNLLLVEGTWK